MTMTKPEWGEIFFLLDKEMRGDLPTETRDLLRSARAKLRDAYMEQFGDGGVAAKGPLGPALSFRDGQLVARTA